MGCVSSRTVGRPIAARFASNAPSGTGKARGSARFVPMHRWTDQKLVVHAGLVIALLLGRVLLRGARPRLQDLATARRATLVAGRHPLGRPHY